MNARLPVRRLRQPIQQLRRATVAPISSLFHHGRTSRDGLLLAGVLATTSGERGVTSSVTPILVAGSMGMLFMLLIPWSWAFSLLAVTSIATKFKIQVGTVSLQLGQIVLIPVALRALLGVPRNARTKLEWPEACLAGFIALQFVTSYLEARNTQASIQSAGLLALGALGYVTVVRGSWTRDRLLLAGRAMLVAGWLNAAVAVGATFSHSLFHTAFGISNSSGNPAFGLAHENNIQGAISAATAIAFLCLMREDQPVFPRAYALVGFLTCSAGALASLTRGAWIGFAIGLVAMLILRKPTLTRGRVIGRAGAIVLSLTVGVAGLAVLEASGALSQSSVSSTGSAIVNFSSGTGEHRFEEWQIALSQAAKSPLIGLGTNSYGQRNVAITSLPKLGDPGAVLKPGYLGNLWIRTFYDSGIVGLVLWVAFLLGALWPGRAVRMARGDLAPLTMAFLFGSIVLAVAFAATDASFQIFPWLFIGVVRAGIRQTREQTYALTASEGGAALEGAPGGSVDPSANGAGMGSFGAAARRGRR